MSKDRRNITLGRSPSIARHPTRLCSSAPQKAPKDTKITTFLQIVPEPVNTLNKLPQTYPFCFSSSKTDWQSL